MNLLEAVLCLTVAWLLLKTQNYRFLTALEPPQATGLAGKRLVVIEEVEEAEQRLQRLTDQAVLAMAAELRRQLRNDW